MEHFRFYNRVLVLTRTRLRGRLWSLRPPFIQIGESDLLQKISFFFSFKLSSSMSSIDPSMAANDRHAFHSFLSFFCSYESLNWPNRGLRSTCSSPLWVKRWVPWVTLRSSCASSSSSLPSWECNSSARIISVHGDKMFITHFNAISFQLFYLLNF